MSSATSIEGPAPPTADSREPAVEVRAAPDRDGFKAWHFFVLISLLGATAAVVVIRQPAPEHLLLISVIVGAAGGCGAALYRTLLPLVRPEAADERTPVSGRARAVLEREKMLALRSIKELEFDRAMGKVSPADFDELSGKLRARALSLMKQLDASPEAYRATIERELASRLEAIAPAAPTCACGTANDADASFCKRCGARLRA